MGLTDSVIDKKTANYDFIIAHFHECSSPIPCRVSDGHFFDEEIDGCYVPEGYSIHQDKFDTIDTRIGIPDSFLSQL